MKQLILLSSGVELFGDGEALSNLKKLCITTEQSFLTAEWSLLTIEQSLQTAQICLTMKSCLISIS